jgi:hypothetical protein
MPRLIEAGGGKRLIEAGGGKRDSGRRLIEAGGGRRITAEEAEVEYQVAREEIVPDAPEESGVPEADPVVDQVVTEDAPEEDVDFTEAVARENINPEEIEKEEE